MEDGECGEVHCGPKVGEDDFCVQHIWVVRGKKKEDKAVTEAIMTAIRAEIDQEQRLPTFIMGDINASPDKLHNLNELVDEEGWIDVGSHADWW